MGRLLDGIALGGGAQASTSLNIREFVDQTSEVLRTFAEVVAHFSKQSMRIAWSPRRERTPSWTTFPWA
jgi:hypothetical protein